MVLLITSIFGIQPHQDHQKPIYLQLFVGRKIQLLQFHWDSIARGQCGECTFSSWGNEEYAVLIEKKSISFRDAQIGK